jgi:hypothetical protein
MCHFRFASLGINPLLMLAQSKPVNRIESEKRKELIQTTSWYPLFSNIVLFLFCHLTFSFNCRTRMEMREDALPRKEAILTTQEIVAFVRRGYDAYNAHQSDPHWLDYATEDVNLHRVVACMLIH